MKKTSVDLPGMRRLKTLGSIGGSSIPPTPKSAFLDLFMRQSAKDRLLQEEDRLAKEKTRLQERKRCIDQNLAEINKRMAELLKLATKASKNLGEFVKENKSGSEKTKSKKHTIISY